MSVYVGALPAGWTPPDWWASVKVAEGGRLVLPPGKSMTLEEMSLFTAWKKRGVDPVQELARLRAKQSAGGIPWKLLLPVAAAAFFLLRKR
jgi:hypothetical protein